TVPEVTPARLPPKDKMFLTNKEASQVSGLSQKYLQDLVQSGSLKSIRDTPIKIRRSDLGTIS
ncbi:MAG: helix-turn-helix domain-containing protein, partial [Acidobacteriota bacterium]|nr:helix-turn-helix domain-containing protein [Acidobacteriota bacterium]